MRERDHNGWGREMHLPAEEIGHARCHALVGDMNKVDTGVHLDQLNREMAARRADTRGCEGERARLRFRQSDQLFQISHRHRRMRNQHAWTERNRCYGHKIPMGIVGQLRIKAHIDREARRDDEQGMSVGRRACRDLAAHNAVRATAIVDDDLLSP